MNYSEKIIARDSRRGLRIKDHLDLSWKVKGGDESGKGTVHNISTTGMLLETDSNLKPFEDCHLTFDTVLGANNYIPEHGRLVWFKKKGMSNNRFLCGVEFVEPQESVIANLHERIQKGVVAFSSKKTIQGVAKFLAYGVIVALAWYIIWLCGLIYTNLTSSNNILIADTQQQAQVTGFYNNLYKETKQQLEIVTAQLVETKRLYEESQAMLVNVQEELEATKAVLAQTEAMLNEAKSNNSQLVGEIQINEEKNAQTKADLEGKIALLEMKNTQLVTEMEDLNAKIRYFEGEFKGTEEGKALLSLYRSKIKLVKTKLNYLKREALEAHVIAQKERDRIRSALGNNGYMVRDGAPVVVDLEKYNAGVEGPAEATSTPDGNKTTIDVKFVE